MLTNPNGDKQQSPEDIQIGRLERKIEKLKRQVNYYKEQCCHYQAVINLHPGLVTRHRTYTEFLEEKKRVAQLEERVREQAKLILLMEEGK